MLKSRHIPRSSVFRDHISNYFKVILPPLEGHMLSISPAEGFANQSFEFSAISITCFSVRVLSHFE